MKDQYVFNGERPNHISYSQIESAQCLYHYLRVRLLKNIDTESLPKTIGKAVHKIVYLYTALCMKNKNDADWEDINKIVDAVFKEYDIPICPGYIFGFDNDDKNTFQEAFDFLKKFKVQRVALTILTPYPGTKLYEQFKKEKRIINNDLSLYDCSNTVFQPKKMSINNLTEEYWKLNRRFYSIKEIFSRLIKAKKSEFLYSLITNFRFRSLVYQNINQYNSGIKRIN